MTTFNELCDELDCGEKERFELWLYLILIRLRAMLEDQGHHYLVSAK